jgi:hypothetical protein
MPANQGQAIEMASKLISEQDKLLAKQRAADWRKLFAEGGAEALRRAGRVVKGTAPGSMVSADDMRAEWVQWWHPEDGSDNGYARRWRAFAAQGGLEEKCPAVWSRPGFDVFAAALRAIRGAGGFDGWMPNELQGLLANAVDLMKVLYDILVHAVEGAAGIEEAELEGFYVAMAALRVVGIPKKGTEERRPIAVASVLHRAWQKTLLPTLGTPSLGQFAGRAGHSAVTATASWWAGPGTAGAEIDLRKAFDSVRLCVAFEALAFRGVPREVVQHLLRAWRPPRFLCVGGDISAPIAGPTSGLPPGDPLSPAVLDAVLAVWHGNMTVLFGEAFRGWLFMDDRSFKIAHADVDEAARVRDEVIDSTIVIDSSVGLQLHNGKTQLWQGADASVEHLGLVTEPCASKPAHMRSGYPDEVVEKITQVPGGAFMRTMALTVYVMPKILWAAPLTVLPPVGKEKRIMEVALKTRCTWWCRGRWFMDNLSVHPRLVAAVRILGSTYRVDLSDGVRAAREQAAAELGLGVHSHSENGILVHAVGNSRPVREAADRVAILQRTAVRVQGRRVFQANSEAGRHVLRTAARARLLGTVEASRADAEGIAEVDIEASTNTKVRKWVRTLNTDGQRAFTVWRGGAAWTPSRRYWRPGRPLEEQDARAWCLCGDAVGSARHYFAECPFFDEERARISRQWRIPPAWWTSQPRVTAKSGWITYGAAATKERRVELAVATAQMGVAIVQQVPGWYDDAEALHIIGGFHGGCVAEEALEDEGGFRQCILDYAPS